MNAYEIVIGGNICGNCGRYFSFEEGGDHMILCPDGQWRGPNCPVDFSFHVRMYYLRKSRKS